MGRWSAVMMCAAALLLGTRPASAGDNDLVLSSLGQPNVADPVKAREAQESFARFVTDFGLAVAPLPSSLAASMGTAGFSLTLSTDLITVQPVQTLSTGRNALVWPTTGGTSKKTVSLIPTLHLRKGLPLGFEVGTSFGFMTFSSMVSTSGHLKWAFFEGLHLWPDLSAQAFVTTVIGSGALSLMVGGWELAASERFSLDGGSELGLGAGYQRVGINAETGEIDFSAEERSDRSDIAIFEPLPYLEDKNKPLATIFAPVTSFTRVYGTVEWRRHLLTLGVDLAYAWGNNRISDFAGEDSRFDLTQWRVVPRIGLRF